MGQAFLTRLWTGSLSFEAKKLEIFPKCLSFSPRALEFNPEHWSFEDLESDRSQKNGCVVFCRNFAQKVPYIAFIGDSVS